MPSQVVSGQHKPIMPGVSPASYQPPEEATIFANDESNSFQPNDQYSQTPGFVQPNQTRPPSSIPIKAILILLILAVSGYAAFKIQAICEPFGLCSAEESEDDSQKKQAGKESNTEDDKNAEPPAGNRPSPNRDSSLGQSDPSRSQQVQPSLKQKSPSAPQPNEAPLRDEPLW
jgi:hypothetical protein